MKYTYCFTEHKGNKAIPNSCTVEVSAEFHINLTDSDNEIRANDYKHERCDRKHQWGKRPISFDEIPRFSERVRAEFAEIIRETANCITGESVVISQIEDSEQAELLERLHHAIKALSKGCADVLLSIYAPDESYLLDENGNRRGSYDAEKEVFIPMPRKTQTQLINEYIAAHGCSRQYVHQQLKKGKEKIFKMLMED